MLKVLKLAEHCCFSKQPDAYFTSFVFYYSKLSEKAVARKYPTCLDIYGCRELGLSEAKVKFTFALKRLKEKSFSNPKDL